MDENLIARLEREGVATATFRRLNPARREKIYLAALESFSVEVFDRVTLDSIAEKAGISKGSLIQYFLTKENLLKFAIRLFIDDYRQYWNAYFSREIAIRTRERINAFFQASIDLWEKNKMLLNFYLKMRYENDSSLTSEFRKEVSMIQSECLNKIIARGVETGELRRDIDPDVISQFFIGLIRNMELAVPAALQSARGKSVLINQLEKSLAALFDGLKA